MSDRYTITTAQIATGTAVKTILEFEGPATRPRIEVDEVAMTFEGVTATGVPIEVELCAKTADATGGASPPSPVPDDTAAPASACTVRHNASAEGTVGVIFRRWLIHPQAGIVYQLPLGRTIKLSPAQTIALRVTAAASVDCVAHFGFIE